MIVFCITDVSSSARVIIRQRFSITDIQYVNGEFLYSRLTSHVNILSSDVLEYIYRFFFI